MSEIEKLREKLRKLHLRAMARELDGVLKECRDKNLDQLAALERLADIELDSRYHQAVELRYRQSHLREKLTIDAFDFHHHKSRADQKQRILSLMTLEFIRAHADAILIGNPGTGKTFIAKCVAHAACLANIRVLFTTAIEMINHLIAAEADRSLIRKLRFYQSPDLLVCDELGYLALGPQGSHLFFQVISQRHQQRSTLVTTNLPFADWGKVFDSTTVATAIADRLVHNSEVLILGGSSYRRKER